jgi:hypothetical protein
VSLDSLPEKTCEPLPLSADVDVLNSYKFSVKTLSHHIVSDLNMESVAAVFVLQDFISRRR